MNNHYELASRYNNDSVLCESLNKLTQSIWGITVLHGGETDYLPFSALLDGEVVANVCVGVFDVVISGVSMPANMIQTVLTHEDHRKKGLIRTLFEPVQSFIRQDSGRTFFTASKDKKDFYGKFGYQAFPLVDHFLLEDSAVQHAKGKLLHVDLGEENAWTRFSIFAKNRAPVSEQFGFHRKPWLLLWFCQHFHHENVYWISDLNVYMICRKEGKRFEVLDIIGPVIPTWRQLQPYLFIPEGFEVCIYFVPDKLDVEARPHFSDEDDFYTDKKFPVPDLICLPETQRG